MITAVLLIAALNLGAGFAVAVFADSPWSLALPTWPRRRQSANEESHTAATNAGSTKETDGLAASYLSQLASQPIDAESVTESILWTVHVASLEARTEMLPIDQAWRGAEPELQKEALSDQGARWVSDLESWAELLGQQKNDEATGALASRAEEFLLDQQFQAKSTVNGLLDQDAGSSAEVPRLLAGLFRTLDDVRDFTAGSLAELLREGERYRALDEAWLTNEPSGCLSRFGMENLFGDWSRDDPECIRMASCVFVDIDRVSAINESVGPYRTDQCLAKFGALMRDLVRKDRGFDRVVRFDGQCYVLFFGDTGSVNAASGAERIRQTIEASCFQWDEETVNLSATCAVAELPRQELLSDYIARLKRGVAEAQAAGRNRTFVDDGTGPLPVSLPQYQVQRREIKLND